MAGRMELMAVETMPEWVQDVVDDLTRDLSSGRVRVRRVVGSSNELLELGFDEDRVLMVKRGRHDWVQEMFDTAAAASELLQARTDLTVPRPLSVETDASSPLQAYWRIQLPTLGALWAELSETEKDNALRSLGALIRRLHQVDLPGWGSLLDLDTGSGGLESYLRRDLADRLLPAVIWSWDEGVEPLEQLIETIPAVAARVGGEGGTLSHSDVHLQNVLCTRTPAGAESVGLLDLDNCRSLPPEADMASFQVLHGPLFNQELSEPRHAALREGYGGILDPVLLTFFRASHLANLGFHSALVGDEIHAGWVAEALSREVRDLAECLGEGSGRTLER